MTISFTVPYKPQGKARPRFDGRSGRAYTPKGTKEYEEFVRTCYLRMCHGIELSGEVQATVTAYFPVPKNVSKSKRTAMLAGKVNPTVKPDADNIIKAILDALNGYAYRDDAAVTKVTAIKKYGEFPRVEVVLTGGRRRMKPMNVLVACEESQRVCTAFREKGHRAFSCDIQECSGGHPEWHIQGDVLPLINGNCEFLTMDGVKHTVSDKWDLLIAHPPCTYMSNAGACRMYPKKGVIDPERFKKALEAKDFFMQFYNADCPKICIENPMPLKVVGLPKETQRIQPYQFGEPWSKKTYLWLKGLPNLQPTKIVDYKPFLPSGTGRKLGGESYGAAECAHESKARSKTFWGIACAMAEQWGKETQESVQEVKKN